MRNAAAHTPCGSDNSASASPNRTKITPEIMGVANEAIKPPEYERTRRIPGSQGAFPLGRETPERAEEEQQADGEEGAPDELEDHLAGRPAERRGNRVPPGDPDRHENGGGERKDRDREEMT